MNERFNSIRHGNLRKPNYPDSDELKELLALGPLSKINRILRKDDESKLSNGEQNLKLAARHHNFTPLENAVRTRIQSKHGFPSEQPAVDAVINTVLTKLAEGFNAQSKTNRDNHEKKRLVGRLHSEDSSPKATQLREEVKMPYHKARRVSIPINDTEADDEGAKQRITALRRILFIDPQREALETAFMGNLAAKDSQIIKQLARLITGTSLKDMRMSQTGRNPTNRDVHLLIYQGLREIPVSRIETPTGKVLLEVTCSYPRWSAAHSGSLTNLDGSWTDGQINFYHRQKKLERKQVEQIFNRWLKLNRDEF